MMENSVPLIPIALDDMEKSGKFIHIYEKGKVTNLRDANLPNNWTNFYRSDDVAAATFFYLNAPSNNLPAIKAVDYRTAKLK